VLNKVGTPSRSPNKPELSQQLEGVCDCGSNTSRFSTGLTCLPYS
jgi:hypothetical protein